MSKFAAYEPGQGRPRLGPADGLVIRWAGRPDLDPAAALAAEREGEPLAEWLLAFERLEAAIEGGRAHLLVADLAGRIVGYGKSGYFAPPADSPPRAAPEGWYLTGMVVDPAYRRRGLGLELTRARLAWISARSPHAYYFANERNRVSIELHQAVGFVELTRDFFHPGVRFEGGAGILFGCDLRRSLAPA